MNAKSFRGVPCLLLLAATFAAVPAFAASAVGAGTSGATRIVSGTEDFVGPGGAAISGAALKIAAPAERAKALTKSQCFSPSIWTGAACRAGAKEG